METAISACHVIPARELASLAHACGTLKNVTKPQMLVRLQILACMMRLASGALHLGRVM